MFLDLPPFVPFLLAAIAVPFLRGWPRAVVLLGVPILGGINLIGMEAGIRWRVEMLGYELSPWRVDRLSLLFGYLFHIAAFLANLYALHLGPKNRDRVQHAAAMGYAGSALGAVFAGDLITLFIFWEGLALTSVFLIWARGSQRAWTSGLRYLLVNVVSGLLLLAGAVVHVHETGGLEFVHLGLSGPASWLIFLAFGIKAAFPMLHNWLSDAYPEATVTGAIYLTAFTTKVAVYSLARGYPGTEILVYIGAVMACFPIFYAVIENDLRRVLAYSMINQIGFMVVGIGIGTELAVNGAVAHAFNDVIFKGLLFMAMGSVLQMTGRIDGSDLGGLYKTMPLTTIFCIVGAASISAFPLFSGFVSKSMVMSAALYENHNFVWLALLFASAGVFHHAGIKIPYFAFFSHDSGIRAEDPPKNMLLAMGIAAGLCIFIGSFPQFLYGILPFDVDYTPYDVTHVLTQTQILFWSALAFVWLNLTGLYPPELRSTNLDADWIYRRLAPGLLRPVGAAILRIDTIIRDTTSRAVGGVLETAFRHHGPRGLLARTWATGSMVLWVAVLLGAVLLFYYV